MVCLIITIHNRWSKEVVLFIYWTFEHNQCYVLSKLPQPILIMGSHYTGVKGTISNQHLCNFCLDNDTRTEIYNCYENIATNMFWQKFDNKYRSNTAEQPFRSAWLNLEYPILARLAVRMNWLNMRDNGQQDWKIDQTGDKGRILQDGATRMRLLRNNLLSTRLGKRRGSGSLIWGWPLRIGANVAGAFRSILPSLGLICTAVN